MSGGPSVAQATGTRVDSAAKHQIPVRASYEHLLSWVGYDQNVLQKEKHAFSIAKDDMVIGISRPIRQNESAKGSTRNRAYPAAVTTLARMETPAKNYLVYLYHNATNFQERDKIIQCIEKRPDVWDPAMSEVAKKQIAEMPEFYFIGYSVGMGYAHPLSGDNTCTAQMGGMRTILNGAFPVSAGDTIQFYWSAETGCFDSKGYRLDAIPEPRSDGVTAFLRTHETDLSTDSARRKAFYDRGNGVYMNGQSETKTTYNGKLEVAFPKPLKGRKNGTKLPADCMRAFGKAMGSSRPYEMFDVLLFRQSA
jgi:hypothetical protein